MVPGSGKLQLDAAVEIESQSIGFGFTHWLRHQRLDPMK